MNLKLNYYTKGYTEHVISTGCEWAFTILIMLFLITFFKDFKRLKIHYILIIDQSIPTPFKNCECLKISS